MKKQTFALYFGNRGFMPAELIEGARDDMVKAVTDAGYGYIMMDKDATRYGAVETRDEGRLYAKWLKSHEGEYDGVILCMPIFVDENGAIAALQDAGVPMFRTDELGSVVAVSDGREISITWENQNAAPEDAVPADPAMNILYGNKKSFPSHFPGTIAP